ncbi:vanillate/3-O-methylgallate O-demethylase [Alkalilacustris brevis]|uniref:vanillate/3-O-methylgallate O-demethylase n=1 Tax=Alkalilacustris brevis TaxID=2026338 RepID=UPI000E0CCEE7|nr:aminomethyltransferase family protein [Alkalilacustris brevis]
MSTRSLEELLKSRNPVEMLRNSQIGAYVYPVVPPEFTNWRDEQRAWRDSAVLFDQSHHMAELMVEGPGAFEFLNHIGFNSFKGFAPNKAKHFIPCAPSGHVIGDVILFYMAENQFLLVGRAPTVNWVQFQAETTGADVKLTRDDRSPSRPMGKPVVRRHYRFQVQGPNAWKILEKVNGGPIPDVRFFNMDAITIKGTRVRCLRHGMAGAPGLELFGPYEQYDEIREALMEAGAEFGIVAVGARAYATNTLESGWIPSPLPAVYTGEATRAYREWLGADSYEATGSIGGSFVSDNIEDYYLTPFELGYGPFIKYDHDFIGREALEAMKDQPHRRKVTFEWNPEDVMRVHRSHLEDDVPFKAIDLPLSNYAASSYDSVMMGDRVAGLSMFSGYSFNERSMLSLGVVDPYVKEGDVLTMIWGEPDGGTAKTTVERHRQTEIRVKVAPVPYAREAREGYVGSSWRARQR